jgi:GMP synthase-like glutamine amidotransferase
LKLGILKAGRPPRPAIPQFGTYPDMFMRLLGPDAYDYAVFDVEEGRLPAAPEACDAYLVTGSSAGVYEAHPWITGLLQFLRAARGRAKLVGVCFGHQAMAQAFGGRVVKSDKGWGLGEAEYRIVSREPWMDDGPETFRLPASHQDQVVALPDGAEVMAGADFAPLGALAWRDQPAVSMQLHPEFEPAYAIALIEARRGKAYTDAQADAAIATYQSPDDRERVGRWIRRFLDET